MERGDVTEAVEQRLRRASARLDGTLLMRVPIAGLGLGWPEGAWQHHIDGIVVHGVAGPPRWAHEVEDIDVLCRGREVTLVVGRGYADRTLLGLLLGGGDMFSRSYPNHGRLRHLAVIDGDGREANMAWVYDHLGVQVVSADG